MTYRTQSGFHRPIKMDDTERRPSVEVEEARNSREKEGPPQEKVYGSG